MRLCDSAYWIATKGGTETFNLCNTPVWEQAYSQLLGRISSDEVAITGVRDDGQREKIAGYRFANIGVLYPWSDNVLSDDLHFSDDPYLCADAYLDEYHWQRANDRLQSRRGIRWANLMVLKSDILRWWPFVAPDAEGVRKFSPGGKTAAAPSHQRQGAKSAAITDAVAAIYPDGVPSFEAKQTRNAKLAKWIKEKTGLVVSSSSLRDWFRAHP